MGSEKVKSINLKILGCYLMWVSKSTRLRVSNNLNYL